MIDIPMRDAPRSMLFVPGDRVDELLAKAVRSGADAVAIDLEDSVNPQHKVAAREAVIAALQSLVSPVPVAVRINAASSQWFAPDIAGVHDMPNVAAIMVPKCETPTELQEAQERIGDRRIALIALVESARGLLGAPALATATESVVGLALGAEDLAAENGMRRTASGREIAYARSLVVLAAHAAGRWAVDTACLAVTRSAVVRRDSALARGLGFDGKLVLHPRQVRAVHEAFSPTSDEILTARRILDAYARATDSGRAVAVIDGRMIDAPAAAGAERLLRRVDQNPSADAKP
jgi:citrate lyase subunit beta/citryl-CoA lyase